MEAASVGKPMLFGPFMHNFAAVGDQLLAAQAARQVANAAELPGALHALLADPAAAGAMGQRAMALIDRSRGALQRTLTLLTPLLNRSSTHRPPSG